MMDVAQRSGRGAILGVEPGRANCAKACAGRTKSPAVPDEGDQARPGFSCEECGFGSEGRWTTERGGLRPVFFAPELSDARTCAMWEGT